jgi:glycosyltransferase involved in cell wall biosynthesis
MKILIVIHALPRDSLGGSEVCAAALAAALAKRHDVTVCAGRPAFARSSPRREPGPGYTIEWLDSDRSRAPTFAAAYHSDVIDAQFDALMARVAPDIVHIHGIWGLSNDIPMIARRHGAAVAFTLHDFWLMCPRGQRLRPSDLTQCHDIETTRCAECLQPWIAPPRWPSRRQLGSLLHRDRPPLLTMLRRAQARVFRPPAVESAVSQVERYHATTREILDAVDLFLAPSRFLAHEFRRHYPLPEDRIVYSENGIETAGLDECPYKCTPTVVRFGFLGSWMPSKGLHVLVEAFRGLTENARLMVYGGAPPGDPGVYAEGILAAATDRRISFHGRINREQVPAAFRSIDALVVPSLWYENAPLTIREAFASHTPVIAGRCGGMAESVRDGIDGLLFTPGDVGELRAALRRLIHEPDLLPSLSRQTRAARSVDAHVSELEGWFERLIARERPLDAGDHAHSSSHS